MILSDQTTSPKIEFVPPALAEEGMKHFGMAELVRQLVREAYAGRDEHEAPHTFWLAQITHLCIPAYAAYTKAEALRSSTDLYLSPKVSDRIFAVAESIDTAHESVTTDGPNQETPRLTEAMRAEVVKLLSLMRAELQQGGPLPSTHG